MVVTLGFVIGPEVVIVVEMPSKCCRKKESACNMIGTALCIPSRFKRKPIFCMQQTSVNLLIGPKSLPSNVLACRHYEGTAKLDCVLELQYVLEFVNVRITLMLTTTRCQDIN